MKRRLLLSCLLVAYSTYLSAANPKKKPKPKDETPVYFDYICERGYKKAKVEYTYRIYYKDEEGSPPCKVYEIKKGKKIILISHKKDSRICDSFFDNLLNKRSGQGMECYELEGEYTQ